MTEEIKNLSTSEITRNPYQPRITFDEKKLEELAASIKANGLLQPIIVRKSKLAGYELLSGERRFLASQKAGLKEIPAIIRDYTDQQMRLLSIIENLQRENLNPLEEAKSLENLVLNEKLSHEEIGQFLGKSRSYVTNMIRLLKLPKELLFLLEKGEISTGQAKVFLSLNEVSEQLELARLAVRKHLSVRELEQIVKNKKAPSLTPETEKKPSKNIFLVEAEENLKRVLGNSVSISSNSRYSGRMTLEFKNLAELENLIKKLEN